MNSEAPEGIELSLLEPGHGLEAAGDDVWHVLQTTDNEFVPPLSARSGTTTKVLSEESIWGGPITYYENVMDQWGVLATKNDQHIGLLSFIPRHSEELLADWSPSTYISTIAVLPRFRKQGIGTLMVQRALDLPDQLQSPFTTLRTWSTNRSSLGLWANFGFEEVVRLPDHRGPGVDTIYFARRTESGGGRPN